VAVGSRASPLDTRAFLVNLREEAEKQIALTAYSHGG